MSKARAAGNFPLGGRGTGPINVAVQRPTTNLREAENLGEEAQAAAHTNTETGFRFSRHGTLGPAKPTELEKAWG